MLSALFGAASTTTSTSTQLVSLSLYLGVFVALICGLIIAVSYRYRARYTKSFVLSLALLPAIVSVVIALVNGNVGTGVAVAGAFSLVRFRSATGSAKDIAYIFLAMVVGLAAGISYYVDALVLSLLFSAVGLIYARVNFGEAKNSRERSLRITVPEDLNYSSQFDDLFSKYTDTVRLVQVKTSNMGSLFKLSYELILKDVSQEKAFIDELRCRNGNLEVALSYQELLQNEL